MINNYKVVTLNNHDIWFKRASGARIRLWKIIDKVRDEYKYKETREIVRIFYYGQLEVIKNRKEGCVIRMIYRITKNEENDNLI